MNEIIPDVWIKASPSSVTGACSEASNCPGIERLSNGSFAVTGVLAGGDGTEATVIVPGVVVEAAFGAAWRSRDERVATADNAAGQLRAFITEIDAEVTTWRFDLRSRWGNADSLPLYPTDGHLPTTTVGIVRALLADRDHLAARVAELEAHPWIEVNPNADLSDAELLSLMKRAAGHSCDCADYRPVAGSDCGCTNRGPR